MSELFGAPSGQQAALVDMQRIAQTQGLQLQNQQAMQGMQEQQRLGQILQGLSGKGSAAEQMEEAAVLALKGGMVASGSALAKDAAAARAHEAQARHYDAQTFNQQVTAAKGEIALAEKLLGGVTDEASWRASNNLYEQMTRKPSPFRGAQYSPELVDQLRQESMTIKQQIDTATKNFEARTRRMNAESLRDYRQSRLTQLDEQNRIRRSQTEARGKVGGSKADVGAPTKGEIDRADAMVREAHADLPDEEVRDASYSVAARARAIRKTTPGLDAQEAMERALGELSGDFKTIEEPYRMFGMAIPGTGKTATHFKSGGKDADTALTDIPSDPSQRKTGAYYRSPTGKVAQWTGTGWKAAE